MPRVPDPADARTFMRSAVKLDPQALQKVLASVSADGYASGSLATVQQLGPGASLGAASVYGADAKAAWSAWAPGNASAADLLSDGGFQDLLDAQGATIAGIGDSMLDRMGTALAQGALSGDSVDSITDDLYDILGDDRRAEIIANTELARATSAASLDTYQQNGIGQWDWILSPDACDECVDMEANNPHSVDDDDGPPLHPECRCSAAPVDPGVSDDQQTDDEE